MVTKKREVAKHDKSFATSFFIHTFVEFKQKCASKKVQPYEVPYWNTEF